MLCELEISDDECYVDSLDVALLCELEISDDECYVDSSLKCKLPSNTN